MTKKILNYQLNMVSELNSNLGFGSVAVHEKVSCPIQAFPSVVTA